jgi:UDP-N-acetylmuramoyl-tripeptide--D-alanyl-D-alanine ligase
MAKKFLLKLLRFFSKKIIKKYHPQVVGITGSLGKTSAKEAIGLVLSSKFSVRKTVKNYNNEIGVPLTIIGVEKPPNASFTGWLHVLIKACWLLLRRDTSFPQILVLEMGADKPGDIGYLVDIAPCNVGVLTFISHAHTEFFGSIKKIAQEKRVIISHLVSQNFAVLNFDNTEVMALRNSTKAHVMTYGFKEGADILASDVHVLYDELTGWPKGVTFKVSFSGNVVPIFLPTLAAEHLIPAVLAALAVGSIYEINLVDAGSALRNIRPLAGHMRLIPGIKKTMIIDDTYNSSPTAVVAALTSLAHFQIKQGAERYAVLSDMLELGSATVNSHREVGLKVAELGIDCLMVVGEASKHTAEAAREAGLDEHKIYVFNDAVSAARFLQDILEQGDVVLVKGSQSMRMEKLVKEIMENPLQAKDLLVRQDAEWQNR